MNSERPIMVKGLSWAKPDWAVRDKQPCWHGYAFPGIQVAWVDGRGGDSLGITAYLELDKKIHREKFVSNADAKAWCYAEWEKMVQRWISQ